MGTIAGLLLLFRATPQDGNGGHSCNWSPPFYFESSLSPLPPPNCFPCVGPGLLKCLFSVVFFVSFVFKMDKFAYKYQFLKEYYLNTDNLFYLENEQALGNFYIFSLLFGVLSVII